MTLTRSLHTTARWASCRAVPRVFADAQTRSLSTALQRSRLGACRASSLPIGFAGCRTYWWSTKAPAPKVADAGDAAKDALASSQPPLESVSSSPPTSNVTESPAPASPIDAASATASLPADSAPVLTDSAPTLVDSLTDAATSVLPPPMQYGDMAALDLVHWTPAGFFPWLMEVTQVSTGLPWWSVIVLTTVGARAALLPLVARSMASAARLAPIQPQIAEIRAEMDRARVARDTLALQRTALKQRALFAKAGVNPLDSVLTAAAQITVQFGFFIGLRRMCALPVAQLADGGFGVLADLTVPDPYYILPIVNTLAINMQLMLSSRDMIASGNASMPHILNGFRVLSVLGFFFISALPAGLNIHLCTSIIAICLQTLLLRQPAVRRAAGIPPLPRSTGVSQPSLRDTLVYMKQQWRQKLAEQDAKLQERDRKIKRMK